MKRYYVALIFFLSTVTYRIDSAAAERVVQCDTKSQVKTLRELAQEAVFNDEKLLHAIKTELADGQEHPEWEMLNTSAVRDIASSLYLVSSRNPKVDIRAHGLGACVNSVAARGDKFFSAGEGSIKVWHSATGAYEATIQAFEVHPRVLGLAFKKNGNVIAATNCGIQEFDGASFLPEAHIWRSLTSQCVAVNCSNDIIVGFDNGSVEVWNGNNYGRKALLVGHKEAVTCLVLNKGTIVSGSQDATVRVWGGDPYECKQILTGHEASVTSLAIKRNSDIVSGSWDSTVRIWDAITGRCKSVIQTSSARPVYGLALRDNGDIVLAADGVEVWDGVTHLCKARLISNAHGVNSLAINRDQTIISGGMGGNVAIWDGSWVPQQLEKLSDTQIVRAAVMLKVQVLENERLVGNGQVSDKQGETILATILQKPRVSIASIVDHQ